MVGTIGPIVYGENRFGKLPITLWIHIVGYVLGGAILGSLLGAIGATISMSTRLAHRGITILFITGFVSLILSFRDLAFVPIPVPQFRKQVPPKWLVIFPRKITALLYGACLGLGVLTYIPVSTFYVAICWVSLCGNPLSGALVMAVFGLGRGESSGLWALFKNGNTVLIVREFAIVV